MSTRARWNHVMHSRPVVQVELDLRDAYAVGRVLVDAAEGKEDARGAARLRQRADGILMVGIAPGLREAEEIADALEGRAEAGTETGRRALAVAGAIREAVDRARRADERGVVGQWSVVAGAGDVAGGQLPVASGNEQKRTEDAR